MGAVAVLVSLFVVGAVLAVGLSSGHPARFTCPTGSGPAARYCAEAQQECLRSHGNVGGATDGDGFSYDWTCEGDVMTSFRYVG